MQSLVIDAAESVGGAGLKLSNRFLVGVVDLMIKLPNYPVMILEVKRRDYVKTGTGYFVLEVTEPQKKFLRKWWAAGAITGVLSFTQKKGKGVTSLSLAAYTLPQMEGSAWGAHWVDHTPLGDKAQRYKNVLLQLEKLARRAEYDG